MRLDPNRRILTLSALTLLFFVLLAASPSAGHATATILAPKSQTVTTTVVLFPSKDNTLYESATGAFSNGQGQHLFAGRTASSAIRRGLLTFDVAGVIPPGSIIASAMLDMTMSRSNSGAVPVRLHFLNAGWGEAASDAANQEGTGAAAAIGDATWLHTFYNTATWTKPGGDYRSTASASTSVADVGVYRWRSAQMAADVQQWVDSPATAYGWIVIGDERGSGTAKRFNTREFALEEGRPRLTVSYVPPTFANTVYFPLLSKN